MQSMRRSRSRQRTNLLQVQRIRPMMELTLTKDMNDQFARVSIVGEDLYCEECNRVMINLTGRQKTRAKVILALAMHEHGFETR